MGVFIAKQPNGLYCRFFTVVDCPTDYNLTARDVTELIAEEAREQARYILEYRVRPYEWVKSYFSPREMSTEKFEAICNAMETPVTPKLFEDIYIFVPSEKQIISIAEGDGLNLLDEDIADGYVDYIYYNQHDLNEAFTEVDGGQIMLEKPFQERYSSMEDCILDVLDMAYGNRDIPYIVLK
jgi:hypothetical protein